MAQQQRPARSVGARGGHEGPVGVQPGPHPTSESALYATRTQRWRPAPGPWTPTLPMDAKSAPTGSLENCEERGFPQRPQPASSSPSITRKRSDAGLERTDGCRELITFRRPLTPSGSFVEVWCYGASKHVPRNAGIHHLGSMVDPRACGVPRILSRDVACSSVDPRAGRAVTFSQVARALPSVDPRPRGVTVCFVLRGVSPSLRGFGESDVESRSVYPRLWGTPARFLGGFCWRTRAGYGAIPPSCGEAGRVPSWLVHQVGSSPRRWGAIQIRPHWWSRHGASPLLRGRAANYRVGVGRQTVDPRFCGAACKVLKNRWVIRSLSGRPTVSPTFASR